MPTYNMLDAKNQLSKLVEAVESGRESEIVIARNGKAAARLVAMPPKQKIIFGVAEGEVKFDYELDKELDKEVEKLFKDSGWM